MRIGLITEGGYPYVDGEAGLWCDRLVRGLPQHEFDVHALGRDARQERGGVLELPSQVCRVRTASLWTPGEASRLGRRARRRFTEHYGELALALCAPAAPVCAGSDRIEGAAGADGLEAASGRPAASQADRFGNALSALTRLALDEGPITAALLSDEAARLLERACRAPGSPSVSREARPADLLDVVGHLERLLRPLSLDWYGEDGLGGADLCHVTSGGSAALAGLIAARTARLPLVVTEYGVRLRAHHLGVDEASGASGPVRGLLAAFHRRLAEEVYREAAVITPGNLHIRRWQERCGADRDRLRTVHPGMEHSRFAAVAEGEGADHFGPGSPQGRFAEPALVWVGRPAPSKDLLCLLHAFAEVRTGLPGVRLRIVQGPVEDEEGRDYLAHCRLLAAQLFPDEASGPHEVGSSPVTFEEIGSPEIPDLASAYAAGGVVVMSSAVEGFPVGLVEAMFCGRATVSTDVGAVVEVIGGTGLVVPPRNPHALAEACLGLLRDPGRARRLGAAARARALELFTVEQNIEAFHSIYLELASRRPLSSRELLDEDGEPLPFAVPAEARAPGAWTVRRAAGRAGRCPGFAPVPPERDAAGPDPRTDRRSAPGADEGRTERVRPVVGAVLAATGGRSTV